MDAPLSSDARRAPDPAAAAERPRVVVVGAGFAGLYAARALCRESVDVLVVDRRNHHLFQPLLYQVATAALAGPDIARPIRGILARCPNVRVLLDEARAVDLAGRRVLLRGGEERWDALILAPGQVTSYFGNDRWERFAPGLKSLEDAGEIRRRVLSAYEAAEHEPDPEAGRAWTTFAIVGAGPTGVELAGALREIATRTLVRDFRRIDPERSRVVLIEASDRVLPTFDPELSRRAHALLEGLGVEVRTACRMTGVDERGLDLLGGERLEARTVLWAAGVRASPLAETLGVELTRDGRVPVEPDLSVPGHPHAFVAGDLAAVLREDGEWVPGMAPAAIQEGRHAAANVLRVLRGEGTRPFRYRDRGVLATVGRKAAVARVGRVKLSGLLAWLAWIAVHLFWLIGFRNRLVVMIEWAWAYATGQRGARVIVDPRARRADADEEAGRGPDQQAVGPGAAPGPLGAEAPADTPR